MSLMNVILVLLYAIIEPTVGVDIQGIQVNNLTGHIVATVQVSDKEVVSGSETAENRCQDWADQWYAETMVAFPPKVGRVGPRYCIVTYADIAVHISWSS